MGGRGAKALISKGASGSSDVTHPPNPIVRALCEFLLLALAALPDGAAPGPYPLDERGALLHVVPTARVEILAPNGRRGPLLEHRGDCRHRACGFFDLHGPHGPQFERERTADAVLLSFLLVWRSGWSCAPAGCCTGTTTSLPPDALAQSPSRLISRRRDRARRQHERKRKNQEAASDLVSGSRFLFWVQLISFFVFAYQWYIGIAYMVVAAWHMTCWAWWWL